MSRKKKSHYVILKLGDGVDARRLVKDNSFANWTLEIQRPSKYSPCVRYHVQRVYPL